MPKVFPIKVIRPQPKFSAQIAAPPYDIVSVSEARRIIGENPMSFLRISLPQAELNSSAAGKTKLDNIHALAYDNLQEFMRAGLLIQDDAASFYVYQMRNWGHRQVGLVCALDVADYTEGRIKIHEHTRPDKEEDRLQHMLACDAQTEPILLAYKNAGEALNSYISVMERKPLYQFTDGDGVSHEVWKVSDQQMENDIALAFAGLSQCYIADGHHRCASAVRASAQQKSLRGKILAVLFPHHQLRILPYHRVVLGSDALTMETFKKKLDENFEVLSAVAAMPTGPRKFGMYCQGKWQQLVYRDGGSARSKLPKLDVTLLSEAVLNPIFGIQDERRDTHLEFIGGLDAKSKIETVVNAHRGKCGFSLYPVSILDLFAYADQNQVMPPKSTWFEPKLKSGLFVLPFS